MNNSWWRRHEAFLRTLYALFLGQVVSLLISSAGFTFCYLLFFPFFCSGATVFNLSTLTSDMWAVVIRIFFYLQKIHWLCYVSFATEAVGLVIYSKNAKDPDPLPSLGDGNHNVEYQALHEEDSESRNELSS